LRTQKTSLKNIKQYVVVKNKSIKMNAKERFLAALKGQSVDRVPVSPKIWVDYSAKLLGTDIRDVLTDPLTALRVIPLAAIKLGFDSARQFPFPAKKIVEENGDIFEINDAGRRIGKIDIDGGLATHLFDSKDYKIDDPFTMAYSGNRGAPEPVVNTVQDAKRIAVPDASVFDELGWGRRQKQVADEFGDKIFLVGDCDAATMSFYIRFRGINEAMFDLITQPQLVHAVMEKGAQIAIARGKYWLDHGMRVLRLNDSAGNMSLISPTHWKEFVYPYIKAVCSELHSYSKDAIVYCHICGNVLPVIDILAQSGLDCIGPLDPLGGFTVKQAREKAGDKICLMGGVDTMLLLNGSTRQVKEKAIECIKEAGTKGGYILSSGCAVPRGCPHENLAALVEASREMMTCRC